MVVFFYSFFYINFLCGFVIFYILYKRKKFLNYKVFFILLLLILISINDSLCKKIVENVMM